MKNIYTFLLIGLVCILSGCEDFLDKREDAGGLEESAIYASYESMRGFLDTVYDKLDNWMGGGEHRGEGGEWGRTYNMAMTDEAAIVFNSTLLNSFHSGSWLNNSKSSNVTEIGNGNKTVIGKAYAALRVVNRIIANIDMAPLLEEQRKEILGQAYFYRAWFYFEVIKRYGGMPIIDKVFEGGDDDIPRVTYRESSEWMLTDLDQAINLLPDTWPEMHYGRPTKLAAMALKARALLYEASPLMQNDLESIQIKPYDKEIAAKAAKAAWDAIEYMKATSDITGVHFASKDEYMNQFWFPDTDLKRCEHIFVYRHVMSTTYRSVGIRCFLYGELTNQTGGESMAINAPTWNAVQMYERKGSDGNYYPVTDPRSGYEFVYETAFSNRDPRFYNNILVAGDKWGTNKGGKTNYIRLWRGTYAYNQYFDNSSVNQKELSGFMCRKYIWPEANYVHTGSTSGGVTYVGNTFQSFFIRVSELYLNLAEASFEATGSATATVNGCGMTAEEAINIIRNRMEVTSLTPDRVSNPDLFREAYRNERSVELMFEGHRWWDLRRWMTMHEVFAKPYPLTGIYFDDPDKGNYTSKVSTGGEIKRPRTFTMTEFEMTKEPRNFSSMKNYWYPLPQHDVDALTNLKQNPGW